MKTLLASKVQTEGNESSPPVYNIACCVFVFDKSLQAIAQHFGFDIWSFVLTQIKYIISLFSVFTFSYIAALC